MTMTNSPHAPRFDTGPLSWVTGEIRDALARSGTALLDAAARSPEAQPTLLLHAKTHLHQAHGALQMVDVDGVGLLTGAAEQALVRFKDGQLACSAPNAQVVLDAYQAIVEYLDELIAGAAPQPARLFPWHRALQELLGAERVHPSDLLTVDLAAPVTLASPALEASERGTADRGPADRGPADRGPAEPDYAACRARFEKALLPYLKSSDDEARRGHALALQQAIATVADGQRAPRARTFWLAMHSFAELVASGALASDLYAKQLFGQINLQVRRLSQGQGELPDAMLRDALFFIAAAPATSPDAQALRAAFRLDGLVPPDYAERRYGRIDPAALKEARDALAQTKTGWDQLALDPDVRIEEGFKQALSTLAGASDKLGAPALAQLLRELGRAAGDSIASGRSDQFSVEMAAAMLFVEQGLDQVRHLPDDFEEHAEAVGARLLALAAGETPPDTLAWQNELAQQIQQDHTVAVLAGEIHSGLRQVEKLLDQYYEDPARRAALGQAAPLLHQLYGALAILDQHDAMHAARHVGDAVRALAEDQGDAAAQAASLQNIAQNIGALGFFTDTLAHSAADARNRFRFDTAAGMFRALPFGHESAGEAAPGDAPADTAGAAGESVAAGQVAAADASVEAELLEIFISEAHEVLALVAETLPAAHVDRGDQQVLASLRRSFHTLKGSGRMVGLGGFADAAAAIERTLNLWLAEARAASPDLLALLARARAELAAWVAELAAGGVSHRAAAALADAAQRVQDGAPLAMDQAAAAEPDPVPEPAPAAPARKVVELPTMTRPAPLPDDSTKRIGELEIALPLYNIYLAETDELLRVLTRDFGEWRHEPLRAASNDALKAVHTLAGTSATVGFSALRDLAVALEALLELLAERALRLDDDARDLLDATLERVRAMLRAFALGELAPPQPELAARIEALRRQLEQQEPEADADADAGDRLDALFAATYDSLVQAPAAPEETADAGVERRLDALFAATYDSLVQAPAGADHKPADMEADAAAADTASVAFDDPFDMPALDQVAPAAVADEPITESRPAAVEEPLAAPKAGADTLPALAAEPVFNDELDPDLLPVFLEEGSDLLPEIGNGLRQWQQDPADTAPAQRLLRTLHTVKGSARMAGAMRLGQHAHELETQIENMVHARTSSQAAFDELMANYDQALLLFEQLQQPAAGAIEEGAPAAQAQTALAQPAAAVRTPLVRVRADILDRLVNQAGEVSITRSRLETQVGTLKTALAEFSDNVARLRRQLREVEMQAESQIASRMSIAGEREFDPLEFDRFTRLQELTRMMAESVNDVASFHDSLTRTVDGAGTDLAAQSRLTRDLQRDLMRVRMVPFSSLAERLFRVARQTAKETDKRVNLDIRGGAVEIDRSVLEQMAAPFEHLLRNAIVHGIESRAQRLALGKFETGELLVQVSQHGNEVAIAFSDDGAGLDLARIRAKAGALGLLGDGAALTDAEVAELIFEPGFSTADALTELAGRGVGMDVVRSEARALGGRVEIATEAGAGACFTIRLPLTTAVAQVVLVAAGGKTWALPATMVEQVLQVKAAALADAHAAGTLAAQGEALALHYLPALLRQGGTAPAQQRSYPVIVARSGIGRVAIQVDEVQGNREVVVKNIGPQLARMPGIAGATVMGSGDIVLILDPVALARHRPPQATDADVGAPEAPAPRRVVMVVDDSLTVRRVTQRLLEREGYQVLLAKDGVDALEQLQQARPDVMLVDIEMPRMDGFDLTRQVRGDAATRAIPIVMITSRSADKHRNYALELGVDGYFGKPFQEPVLLAAIASLLERGDGAPLNG
jgi:chemosensory pili system protein ChpA (sensor histidine kinase/response regulator)